MRAGVLESSKAPEASTLLYGAQEQSVVPALLPTLRSTKEAASKLFTC